MPNVSIKGSLRVLDAENLIFADLYSLKTRNNLLENPQCAIMVYEESSRKGYCFKGKAELISRGPVYDQVAEQIKLRFPDAPPPSTRSRWESKPSMTSRWGRTAARR